MEFFILPEMSTEKIQIGFGLLNCTTKKAPQRGAFFVVPAAGQEYTLRERFSVLEDDGAARHCLRVSTPARRYFLLPYFTPELIN